MELHISVEKALKSLKTRKWRRARKKAHEDDEEEQPPVRRQRQEDEDFDEVQPEYILDETEDIQECDLNETEDAEEQQQLFFIEDK